MAFVWPARIIVDHQRQIFYDNIRNGILCGLAKVTAAHCGQKAKRGQNGSDAPQNKQWNHLQPSKANGSSP